MYTGISAGGGGVKVLIVGGTGLLGSEGARVLCARGHEVVSLALPGLPEGFEAPPGMQLHFGSYLDMADEALLDLMAGCEGFVFAAGVDERVEVPKPAYQTYHRFNIAPLERLLRLAKQAGIRHAVVLGSYFSHFARLHPDWQLTRWHPYIKSRIDQEDLALGFQGPDFDVSLLQLPYIFGAQPGRKPVWVFLVDIIRSMPLATFYPKGGTTMVTARQVGQAIAGAVESSRGARLWPIGWDNMTWKSMFGIMHRHLGMPRRKVVTVPTFLFRLSAWLIRYRQRRRGIEGGLDLVRFADTMSRELYIDKALGSLPLGVTDDDIDAAIGDSMRQSLAAGEKAGMFEMKGD